MKAREVCVIAQFPPPVHGLSKAVETLCDSRLSADVCPDGPYRFDRVDIKDNKRFLQSLFHICTSRAELFYLTISQSRGGNLRDLIILGALRARRRRCLVHLHGGYYRTLVERHMPAWQRRANYRAVSGLTGAIVLSDSFRSIFSGMLDEKRIVAVENCADDQFVMTQAEAERKLAAMPGKPVLRVLWLSNMIKSKGYPAVLEMARLEAERMARGEAQRLRFDFAGQFFEEADRRFFFDYVSEHHLQALVTHHGAVGGEEKRMLLRESDVFILPTRYPREGQPISILEAMGNAMFVVASDHAGIPDLIRDGENGLLLGRDEPVDAAYRRILRVTGDGLAAAARRNREVYLGKFTQEAYLNRMDAVLGCALQEE